MDRHRVEPGGVDPGGFADLVVVGLGVGVDGQGVEAQSELLAGLAGVDVERAPQLTSSPLAPHTNRCSP